MDSISKVELRQCIEDFLKKTKEIAEDESIVLHLLNNHVIHVHIIKGTTLTLSKR